jgi:methyl-accepting chemotaxis protein
MTQWSIRRNLQLLIGSGIAGLAIFAAVAFFTVSQIQVGSDFFAQKRLSNSVAADFENPPQSLQKVYSLAVEAEDAATPSERETFIAQIRAARKDYEQGHEHYVRDLPEGPLHDLVAGESHSASEAWYLAAEQAFFPAIEAGDHAAADAARTGPLEAAYRRDAAAVDEITRLTDDWDTANDLSAKKLVKTRSLQMGGLLLGLLLILLFLGRSVFQEMTRGIDRILGHMEALAACDLSETIVVDGPDEFRRMLNAIERSVASFRDAVQSIHQGASLIAAASLEMEANSRESATHARNNSQQAQQAAASIAEMDAAIQEVSRSSGMTLDIAQNAETSANRGASVVGEAVRAVRSIAQAAGQVEERINSLGQHSAQIGRIVTAIDEIAGQTNLLALNAAIEAARAGEHGRGFAVVAGEVRRLAERTTAATSEVRQMVGAIQKETEATIVAMHSSTLEVESGVDKTEMTATVLETIRGLAHESGEQAAMIATSTQQQSSAIRDIHTGIDSMAEFAGHTRQATEQTVEACQSLSQLASELNRHSERFRLPS